MRLALDHLVLAAQTLGEGLDWCERAFGIRPDAGGRHDFMGTHNRVFAIGSAAFPRAYFELIAIDPGAPAPAHPRWFDLDDPALQLALAKRGPQLVHWVARCDGVEAVRGAFIAAGADPGDLRPAERAVPGGLLRWRISVRADGRRALGGAVPALIEWGDTHPTASMPESGVTLQSMRVADWPGALTALLPAGVAGGAGAAPIHAVLIGPRGRVNLDSFEPPR